MHPEAVGYPICESYTPAYLPSLETIRRWRVANWDYHILSTAGVIKPEPGTKQLEI